MNFEGSHLKENESYFWSHVQNFQEKALTSPGSINWKAPSWAQFVSGLLLASIWLLLVKELMALKSFSQIKHIILYALGVFSHKWVGVKAYHKKYIYIFFSGVAENGKYLGKWEKQVNSRNAEYSQGFSGWRIEILKCKGSEIYDLLASEDSLQHFLIFFYGTLLRAAGDMIREIQKI